MRCAAWLLLVLTLLPSLRAEVVLRPLEADATRGPNLIPNPGFEDLTGGRPTGWDGSPPPDWQTDHAVTRSGQGSLRFVKPDPATRVWVSRRIILDQTRPLPLVVSGWSKADKVTGTRGADYSVWVDLQYVDGTPLYGQRVSFEVGTHDWEYAEFPFIVTKPVRAATVHLLFRGDSTGTVWFDDVSLQELQDGTGAVFENQPVTVSAGSSPLEGASAAELATQDGLVLSLDQRGAPHRLRVSGRELLGRAPGGFWLRDVAAGGPWVRPDFRCTAAKGGTTLTGGDPDLGLDIHARLVSTANGVDVETTLRDTTGRDRAVTAYFVLPLVERRWTWHDDIVRSVEALPNSEYRNAQCWPATGMASAYPFCALTSDDAGLALSVPMDCPRVCRFVYNSHLSALFVAFDLGLSPETINFPSRASFRFSLFAFDPRWGFRAATETYHTRHPRFFTQRLQQGGIWMAFGDISKIEGWQDFGFAYDELGGNHAAFDNANQIACFRYVEPMTWHMSMDPALPRTRDEVTRVLAAHVASDRPDLKKMAQITQRCGVLTRDGHLDFVPENESWCDGVVFTLNPDPKLPEDAACPVNQGHAGYDPAWADRNLKQKTGPSIDGIYVDSMPNWGQVRNHRREHWRTAGVPLTFDPETRQPVLLQIFSTWEFSNWVAADVHARGGVMHGNGGTLWPFFPALLDVTGQETGSVLGDKAMAQARTLLRNKPYSSLMNTRFDRLDEGTVVEYFNKSLLYGIFPSFFNGSYLQDGKWVTVSYFNEPRFYERDRPLYRKYIPILRRLFAAGWQPVTGAIAIPAGVRVERYGPQAGGEVLFALYNPAATAVATTLSLDAATLTWRPGSMATELVTGQTLPLQHEGGQVQARVSLPPGTCYVVQLEP